MSAYAALDVSMKATSVHIVDGTGACLWRGEHEESWGAHATAARSVLTALTLL